MIDIVYKVIVNNELVNTEALLLRSTVYRVGFPQASGYVFID